LSLKTDLRDELRRLRKRAPDIVRADILFSSHAKSGRTWLRAMISRVYHLDQGTPERELIDYDNFKKLVPAIPSLFFTSDYNEPRLIRAILPRLAARTPRLLVMVRDPRDVAVSYYLHHLKRSNPRVRRRLGMPEDLASVPIERFVTDKRFGLASVIRFLNNWNALCSNHRCALRVRYEDLRASPAKELERVMAFLGNQASRDAIDDAVQFTQIDRLREMERFGFYQSERLQARDSKDPDSFKVRRGKVGGWRDHFDASTRQWIDSTLADQLDPDLGYV